MSRIGRKPIPVPAGVEVRSRDGGVEVEGPKGRLTTRLPPSIEMERDGGALRFLRADDRKQTRAYHGLARALVANMVRGVTEGFSVELVLEGVGYRAELRERQLELSLGYSHPVRVEAPAGIEVQLEGQNRIRVAGIDRERVGGFAAELRALRPPEPYKGKGVRYADEKVRRKVGKSGASGSGR